MSRTVLDSEGGGCWMGNSDGTVKRPATRIGSHVVFPGGRCRKLTLRERWKLWISRNAGIRE